MTEFKELLLASIEVGTDRARPLDESWAEKLAANIKAQGLLDPVLVREVEGGFRLIDGRHRIRAHEVLGLDKIRVTISEPMTDDMARMAELTANLAVKLVALDKCHHFHELKQVWLRLHPEYGHGGDRRSDDFKCQNLAFETAAEDGTEFETETAERYDCGKSTIREYIAIWDGLSKASRVDLHGTVLATKKTELAKLAKLAHPRQAKVLELILGDKHPDIDNVSSAQDFLSEGVVCDPLEKRFQSVSRSFGALDDEAFDHVVMAHEQRVIESLRRRERI